MRTLTTVILAILLSAPAEAATRLTYMINGSPKAISWATTAFPLKYEVSQDLVTRFDGSSQAITDSFNAWHDASPEIRFAAGTIADVSAGKDGVNSVSLEDGLFAGNGFIAFTTTWFDDSGRITEADIQIDPEGVAGYDMHAVVQHEIGHFLGLDHSAVVSSAMFPYLTRDAASPLDSDDLYAIRSVYPDAAMAAEAEQLHGEVTGDGAPVFGAQVVALDADGRSVAATLTGPDGHFDLSNLPPGNYRVYAEPLDGPVAADNLSGVWGTCGSKSFRTRFVDVGSFPSKGGQVQDVRIDVTGPPADLNPRWIGVFAPGSSDINLRAAAASAKAGSTVMIAVGGDGLVPGMTTIEIPNPGFHRISDFQYATNYMWATYRIDPGTATGSTVVLLDNGNDKAALTGAIRVAEGEKHRGTMR
ncbi:MAG: matrixin family metalloprotease [Thermoanaerobaculia bacterium]